jgi:hypothetical protein
MFTCLTGLPELQMLPVDPLFVTKISIQEGAGRPVRLNLDLNNSTSAGFSEVEIEAVRYVTYSATTVPRIHTTVLSLAYTVFKY